MKWENIPEYPGYFISKTGKLYSNKTGVWVRRKGLVVNERLQYMMYKTVQRPPKGKHHSWGLCTVKKKWEKAHRLVALAYLPNPENLPIIMHLDNNPKNNRVGNLKWGTQSENIHQAVKQGRFNQCRRYGVDNPMYGKPGPMLGRKGKDHPAYGKPSKNKGKKIHTEESKAKIGLSSSERIKIDYLKVKQLKEKGMSQSDVARIMGIHQTSVSKILKK